MKRIEDLPIKIFADGADKKGILDLCAKTFVKGLTTNPTLMRKAGISDYEVFARDILQSVRDKPISFEVFSDDFPEMRRQAMKIAKWQENVYVKIPITNTRRESSLPLIRDLSETGVKLNVTAMLTSGQVQSVAEVLNPSVPAIVSVFAGRIADTGIDPVPILQASKALLIHLPRVELLWASVREVFNLFQAIESGCNIVTVPHDILNKLLNFYGMDLTDLSLETVRMFAQDAVSAGFSL